ncbi:MAG: peroxiredoxin family protein [Prevotellaceae bacterium]|jgi:peroxiredoxin|nr:peroxiredoxin family protein [Prevotellaceae bacterium]
MEKKKEKYSTIPVFQLKTLNGTIVTGSALRKNVPVLFLFFNPDCDLCRDEMKAIQSQQDAFSFCQIVFFSTASVDKVLSFLEEISFLPLSNILFLIDENEDLTKKMNVRSSPASYIYNRKGKLIKRFDGSVKTETLIKYLAEG